MCPSTRCVNCEGVLCPFPPYVTLRLLSYPPPLSSTLPFVLARLQPTNVHVIILPMTCLRRPDMCAKLTLAPGADVNGMCLPAGPPSPQELGRPRHLQPCEYMFLPTRSSWSLTCLPGQHNDNMLLLGACADIEQFPWLEVAG